MSEDKLGKLGRYDLIRVVGKGAMGVVYEARDPHLERRVAIKTISVDTLSEQQALEYEARFRTEARSAARLQHPHIVSVYDADRDLDVAFLVMEYVEGLDLKHRLDQGARYTLEQTAALMGDLLGALEYAHSQRVIHRDIKPANLLIDNGGRLKLTDFGVARIQDAEDATRTRGAMIGTLKYMAPEQVQGLPVDARCDIFSAGIVLYQLLTGVRPFEGSNDYETIQQIVTQPARPPSSLNPSLPAEIDGVLARALEKDRERRYASAAEFNAALQQAVRCASDPTVAAPAARPHGADGGSAAPTQAGSSASAPSVPASTVTQEVELVYWKEIRESSDPQEFQAYLQRFPDGIYSDLARRRLQRLSTGSGSQPAQPLASAAPPSPDAPTQMLAGRPSPAPAAAAAAAPSSPATSTSRRPAVALAGAAALLAAGALALAVVWQRPAPPEAARNASASPPDPATPPAAAQAPAASPSPAAPPARITAAASPQASPAQAAQQPLARDGHGSASKPGRASPDKPGETAAATTATAPTAAAAVTAASPAAPAEPPDPRRECEGRILLGYETCMKDQCDKPKFAPHPICVERRRMEESARGGNS